MQRILNTLYITTPKAWLSLDGECVSVSVEREQIRKFPLILFDSIVCFGGVGATPHLMGYCAKAGIPISFFGENGRYLARVDGPVRGNVVLRRRQYRMADDAAASFAIARAVVAAKITNTRNTMMRSARETDDEADAERVRAAAREITAIASGMTEGCSLDALRGIEGAVARVYFSIFDTMITAQKEHFRFAGRTRRPPTDAVNTMLSFVYSLLANDIASALEGVGLDPCVGYLHKDRPGRASLALDMMEEFRPWLADRVVLTLIGRQQVAPDGFSVRENGAVAMNDETRRTLIAAWQERKQEALMHPFVGEKMKIGLIPHIQARLLARHIRGDIECYPPFIHR